MWFSLIRMPAYSARRWLLPAADAHRVLLRQAQAGNRLARVQDRAAVRPSGEAPAIASTWRRVIVAVPLSSCRKFSAGRSADSSARASASMLHHRLRRALSRRRRPATSPGCAVGSRRCEARRRTSRGRRAPRLRGRSRGHARACRAGTSMPVQSPRPMSSASASMMLRRRASSSVSLCSNMGPALLRTRRGWARSPAAARWPGGATKSSMRSMQPRACDARRLRHQDLAAALFQAGRPRPAARSSPSRGSVRSSCRWRCGRRSAPRSASCPAPAGACGASGRCRWRRCRSARRRSITAFRICVVEPTTSACATTLAGDSGCTSTLASGCSLAQQVQLQALELVVHDAGAVPQQHVGAGLLLDVAAQVAVGRPQDLPALVRQVAARWPGAQELVTIQSARAFTAALVLA